MMQPYAWLFSRGYLTIDDRAWRSAYRGPMAIHASKGFHREYYDLLKKHTNWDLPAPAEFEHGGIVGLVNMTGCLPAQFGENKPQLRRSHFGGPGYHGFVFEDPIAFEMIRLRGMPGLFSLSKEVQDRLTSLRTAVSV